MEGKYKIHDRGKVVGQASVERQGLYYCFTCSVNMQEEGLYRIIVFQNERKTDLGICLPCIGRYMLTKKIPIKNFTNGEFTFAISDGQSKDKFVPIVWQEPFAYLANLEKGRFAFEDGIAGIIFPNGCDEMYHPQ